MSEFQLSRIQAEGWKAGRALSASESDLHDVAGRNPYKSGQERARWETGFLSALGNASTFPFRASSG